MIDQAGIMMAQGALIASERIIGVNDIWHSPIIMNILSCIILKQENGFIWYRTGAIK